MRLGRRLIIIGLLFFNKMLVFYLILILIYIFLLLLWNILFALDLLLEWLFLH